MSDLFDLCDNPPRPTFDGATYDEERDGARLRLQLVKVLDLMKDQRWRTLAEISRSVEAPEASCSARLRDARKEKFGGHTVNRRRVKDEKGLHEYQLILKGE